ncbi:serine threonine-protein kinase [Phaffia rhodozyma]|uniref:Serine threonine-protein kinase n=1 Tax=Phaffia rhodozyma TaxID=264483 RepID=A0A0F7SX80_PHARH|nr:serine threonine-protein kinase [Phaffia rhodozyma]
MPFVDSLRNFVRHGKNAKEPGSTSASSSASTSPTQQRDHSAPSAAYHPTSSAMPAAPTQTTVHAHAQPHSSHNQAAKQSSNVIQQQAQAAQQQQHKTQTAEPAYRKEAEDLVQEEKRNKERMPVYTGLEGFHLVEKMGDGAFSNVYKAIDRRTGFKTAVKVVRKYELNASQEGNKHLNPNFKKRPRVTERANILKEVQIMRGTDHPSVIKLVSFSESPEHYFLVLELMEGGELFHQIVKLTYFSEQLSRHVILQVAHGIRYLHEERGVVHRDIKPENILFDRIPIIPSRHPVQRQYDEDKVDEGEFTLGVGGGGIGRVKIADFGLSKVVWAEDTATPCGTVGYTAPEIVKDERYSKSVDMWALGCVLYTLLCGFPPFYDESIAVLTEKVARGYYTFLSPWWDDISASSKDLISHLLNVDPAQRYTIDEFLAHPWCNEQAPPKHIQTQAAGLSASNAPMDSPLLQSMRGPGAREGRSPGVASLKEAFDITYAVHRMEEEGARRRAYNGPGGAGARGFLGGLNEDDEEAEEEHEVAEARAKHGEEAARTIQSQQRHVRDGSTASNTSSHSGGGHAGNSRAQQHNNNNNGGYQPAGGADRRMAEAVLYDGRAGQRDQGGAKKGRGAGFELDMSGATLLGRRTKKPSPLANNGVVPTSAQDPGSPMRF